MRGGVVSTKVTVWLHEALLEQPSVAVQVRVIAREQAGPLVMVPVTRMVTFVPTQLSDAEGVSKVQAEPHWTVLLLAQVMTGGVVSTTVTAWLHDAVFEQQSVACHVRVMTSGQEVPFVIVPVTRMVFVPLPLQQPPEAKGTSKLQAEPHWTILLLEQVMTSGGGPPVLVRKAAA
jgi:hypothetical protein